MYKEYKQLNLSQTGKDVLEFWKQNNIFEKSISSRPATNPYTPLSVVSDYGYTMLVVSDYKHRKAKTPL